MALNHYVNLFFQIFKIVTLNVLSLVSKILILARKCKVGHLDNLTADFSHLWRDWVFPEWTFEKWYLFVAKVKRKFQFLLWLHSKSMICYPCGQYRLKHRSGHLDYQSRPDYQLRSWATEILGNYDEICSDCKSHPDC